MMIDKGKWYTTTLVCIIAAFLYADQNLMAPNLSAIAEDFGFSDEERDEKLGGDIALGFFVLGAPAAVIIGYLADTTNRSILLGIVVIFGEAACLGTYFVQTYRQLFLSRVLTGISIGGATPVIFSLMADFYGEESRIYVSTIVGVAISVGQVGGQLMAGMVGPQSGWRMPFLIIAVPSIFLGLLLTLTGTEPKRGSQERVIRQLSKSVQSVPDLLSSLLPNSQRLSSNSYHPINDDTGIDTENSIHDMIPYDNSTQYIESSAAIVTSSSDRASSIISHDDDHVSIEYSERIDWKKLGVILTTPSAIIIFLQGLPGCVPWGMIYTFLNDYFSEDRGMSVEQATIGLSMFGVGGFLGMICGGWLGQKLYLSNKRYQTILMGSSTLLAILPMLYLLNRDVHSAAAFYIVAIVAGFFANINGPNVRSVLQNVCAPEVRGTAFAIFTLTDDIGKGAGPVLVVQLLKACNGHRQSAYNISLFFWAACGLLLLLLMFTIVEDENHVQQRILIAIHDGYDNHTCNIDDGKGDVNVLYHSINPISTENSTLHVDDKKNEYLPLHNSHHVEYHAPHL